MLQKAKEADARRQRALQCTARNLPVFEVGQLVEVTTRSGLKRGTVVQILHKGASIGVALPQGKILRYHPTAIRSVDCATN